MWTATLRNKKSFKRPISKFFFPNFFFHSFDMSKSNFLIDVQSSFWSPVCCLFFFPRDHYVEGKMRGLAPSKKIAAVQQKNVDL